MDISKRPGIKQIKSESCVRFQILACLLVHAVFMLSQLHIF